MFAPRRKIASACLLLALAGCSDKDITSYRIPKVAAPVVASPPEAAASRPEVAALHWVTPSGWQVQAASGLRSGSFLAPGQGGTTADVSIVTFAGAGGDVLANINRWRGQLQLTPIDTTTLPTQIRAFDAPAGHFFVADIRGKPDQGKEAVRILGAWFQQSGRVWFFKMMGPAGVVESQQEAFLGLLRSVALPPTVDHAAGDVTDSERPPKNTNDLPLTAPVAASGPEGTLLRWQAPADWKPKPAGAMRKGSYAVVEGDQSADLSVTSFPGDVGGLAANVNRWRGQLDLPPVGEAALGALTESVEANGLDFTMVDFSGPPGPGQQRILAALASWQGATWCVKLMGPSGMVAKQRTVFINFLKTVRPI